MNPATRRAMWTGVWVLSVAFAIAAVGECYFYVADVLAVRKAKLLLQDIRTLRVGESTEAELQALTQRYRGAALQHGPDTGCASSNAIYSIKIANPTSNWVGWRFPSVRVFGNRSWEVDAYLASEQGRLCYERFQVRPLPRIGTDMLDIATATPMEKTLEKGRTYGAAFWQLHEMQHFAVSVSMEASDRERSRAFDYNFSCVTRWAGCRAASEIMPSAWADYLKSSGLSIP